MFHTTHRRTGTSSRHQFKRKPQKKCVALVRRIQQVLTNLNPILPSQFRENPNHNLSMDRSTLVNLFAQIIDGWDIPTPGAIVKVKQSDAEFKHPDMPYSILTNLAHTVTWQRIWLGELTGQPRENLVEIWKNDWSVPDAKDWDNLRKEFLEGLTEAKQIAESNPFNHKSKSHEKACETLLKIAIHASYHMGQMNLMKRSLRKKATKS